MLDILGDIESELITISGKPDRNVDLIEWFNRPVIWILQGMLPCVHYIRNVAPLSSVFGIHKYVPY